MKTILFLFGGCSTEYEVSLQSAHAVLQALDRSRYTPLAVGITREGRWLRYPGGLSHLETGDWQAQPDCVPCTLSLDRGDRRLLWLDGSGRSEGFDAAFPILHGKNGEDGTVQGLLELVGAPIIGCGALSSALCMDKNRAHKLAALAGVQVPGSAVFGSGASLAEMADVAGKLGYPLFVKPVRAGSSFGVTRVTAQSELFAAVSAALERDDKVVVEEEVSGFEVGCAVLGDRDLTLGRPDEIELQKGFFTYDEKYHLITARIHTPARISPSQEQAVQALSSKLYRALDCRGMARVDLFLTPDGRLIFNEINTIPGFTAHSRYPAMMAAAGLSFSQVLDRLIETAVGT